MPQHSHVLLDPETDRRLKRDGFVKVRLVDREHAARLRARFDELAPPAGEGFVSDFVSEDREYRRAADRAIASELDAAAAELFRGHEPFMHNFLCKYPGASSSLYLHRDWMYVDERAGERTYVVWVALDDIIGDNGQLRVVRGSHLIDREVRGTDLIAPWLAHTEVIEPRLLSVPVEAGECIVFDNALVHCSYPNHTDRPRLAAAVGMRPAGVPLVHFRRTGPRSAVRYDIEPSFFLDETPQGLLASPPDLEPAEEITLEDGELSAEALADVLDTGVLARIDRVQRVVAQARRQVTSAGTSAWGGCRGAFGRAREAIRSGGPKRAFARARAAVRAFFAQLTERIGDVPSKAAIVVLGINEAIINRFGPQQPAVWDPDQFEWSARIEAAYPQIRAEVEALLAGPTDIPHIEDVTGGIPQGNIGPWRTFVLMHQGRWIDWNCARCPETTDVVRSIPGLSMAGFSVLEPGTHITEHRGPNKGALRHQLGVIVPGAEGDCRIRVGDEMLIWREGESVMFDFTVPHEAWNDTDGIRVLLMLEVVTPLPWYLDRPNRLAQHAMTWFPTTRDMTRRLRALEPTLQRPVEQGAA